MSAFLLKIMHLLPAETAHRLTIRLLQGSFVPQTPVDDTLALTLFGRRLRNPIGLAGGADKNAEALRGWTRLGFGLVEAGTVTLHPRAGNPEPRLWRFPEISSLINWMGLPNQGVTPFVERLQAFHAMPERADLCVGASFATPDGVAEELTELARVCAPWVDYITLNASCPNTQEPLGTDVSHLIAAQHIRAVKAASGDRPVLLKLAPTRDVDGLALMVKEARSAGIDGFVAINTLPYAMRSLAVSCAINWPMLRGQRIGGLSGAALIESACAMVKQIRALVGPDMPIIGVGGIQSGADALRMLDAGANAFQIYTGFIYKGRPLLREITEALQNRHA